jgi:hypothetical protein
MAKRVTKRSGKTEPFIREKIVVSCLKSGAPLSLAREIADMVEASQMQSTDEIRDSVLEELGKASEDYRQNWIMHDKIQGKIAPE